MLLFLLNPPLKAASWHQLSAAVSLVNRLPGYNEPVTNILFAPAGKAAPLQGKKTVHEPLKQVPEQHSEFAEQAAKDPLHVPPEQEEPLQAWFWQVPLSQPK